MDSAEIIHSINNIYDKFDIPPSLRMHMYRVTAVANIICDHWEGEPIDKNDIIATCLVHDLGNIVRLDFGEGGATPKIFGNDARSIEHWKQVKKDAVEKYGTFDQDATVMMLQEIGANKRVISIVTEMYFILHKEQLLNGNDRELKICEYGDVRVSPFGIVSIGERIADLRARHRGVEERIWNDISRNAPVLERWIAKNSSIKPEQITDEEAAPYIRKYKNL